jgi:hypothetical protein
MTNNIIKSEDYGIEVSKGEELTKGLKVTLDSRELLVKEFDTLSQLEITPINILKFRELRLKIRDNRTKGISPWHKTNKDFFLTGGRFVDAIKNKEILVNETMESKLLDAEKHFENIEADRLSKLNIERQELVGPYYLEMSEGIFLADMDEDVFQAYLTTKKNNFEAVKAADKLREEKEAEFLEEESKKRELMIAENLKLKKEAQEKEDALNKEREKARAIQKIKDDEAIENFRVEKERADNLEKAAQDAKDAENARIQGELSKGDSDKVSDLIIDLDALKTKYSFDSAKNKKMYVDVCNLIDKVTNHIKR